MKCYSAGNPGTLPLLSVRLSPSRRASSQAPLQDQTQCDSQLLLQSRCEPSDHIFWLAQIRRLSPLGSSVGIALPEELPEFFHQDIPKTLFLVHGTQEHMVFHGIKSISLAKLSILFPLRRVHFVVFGDALRAQLVPDVVTNGEISCTCTASEF